MGRVFSSVTGRNTSSSTEISAMISVSDISYLSRGSTLPLHAFAIRTTASRIMTSNAIIATLSIRVPVIEGFGCGAGLLCG
jgi:hypothetical protein